MIFGVSKRINLKTWKTSKNGQNYEKRIPFYIYRESQDLFPLAGESSGSNLNFSGPFMLFKSKEV